MELQVAVDLVLQLTSEPPPDPAGLPAWQSTLSWALGLPVLLAGALASVYVVPKARLQNKKTALEIEELELRLDKARGDPAQTAKIVAAPIADTRRAQDLILRFVFLYLLLQAWGLIADVLSPALSSAAFGLDRAAEGGSPFWILAYLALALVASVPEVVRALLFVAIGWPILLDIARLVGIDLPDFMYSARARHVLIAVALVTALGRSLVTAGFSAYYTLFEF